MTYTVTGNVIDRSLSGCAHLFLLVFPAQLVALLRANELPDWLSIYTYTCTIRVSHLVGTWLRGSDTIESFDWFCRSVALLHIGYRPLFSISVDRQAVVGPFTGFFWSVDHVNELEFDPRDPLFYFYRKQTILRCESTLDIIVRSLTIFQLALHTSLWVNDSAGKCVLFATRQLTR